jgi:hypothetical protein
MPCQRIRLDKLWTTRPRDVRDTERGWNRRRCALHIKHRRHLLIKVGDSVAYLEGRSLIHNARMRRRTNHDGGKVDWGVTRRGQQGILVVDLRREDWDVTALIRNLQSICGALGERTHSIRLPGHVEGATFKLREVLKEDKNKGRHVLGSLLRRALRKSLCLSQLRITKTYDSFAILSIREPDADRLVYEENVGVGIPTFWVELCPIAVRNAARSLDAVSCVG